MCKRKVGIGSEPLLLQTLRQGTHSLAQLEGNDKIIFSVDDENRAVDFEEAEKQRESSQFFAEKATNCAMSEYTLTI